jgi:branched-chain amino acid transport system substrate-binding protein
VTIAPEGGSTETFGGTSAAAPVALKKAKPGTPEFRAALKDAVETMGRTVVSHGVLNYAKDNHWGFTTETGVILKVVNGDWKVE